MFMRQTGLVLWRTLYVQQLRRHYFIALLELLLVVLCFGQLRHHTSPRVTAPPGSPPHDGKQRTGFNPAIAYPPRTLAEVVAQGTAVSGRTVCYGPDSGYTKQIMQSAYPSGPQLQRPLVGAIDDGGIWADSSEVFEHVAAKAGADVLALCKQASQQHPADTVPCVRFYGASGDQASLNYSVYVYTDEHIAEDQLVQRKPDVFEPPQDPSKLLAHIFSTIARVNIAHLQYQSNKSTAEVGVPPLQFEFRRFPHPSLPKDIPTYAGVVGLILMLGFLVPFCLRVHAMVLENSNGLKEFQRLMGLSDAAYWSGHFCSHLFLALLHSAAAVLCMLLLPGPGSGDPAFLERANLWLLVTTFFLFSVLFSLHAILVASFFTNGSMAVTFAMLYWVILTYVLPTALIEKYVPSLAGYLLASRESKLISSVTPTIGTYWILKILTISEDLAGSAEWDLVDQRVLNLDNVTILEIWLAMVATCCMVALIVAYLSQVLPWVTGIPRPLCFPLMCSYWCPVARACPYAPSSPGDKQGVHFQLPPMNARPLVTVHNLTKDYGGVIAVENVDLEVYEGLITVILGHNGAGKTTVLNTLTGMCSPTSGTVTVCGYDLVDNTAEARANMSFCQQHDVFFADLTVWEHLAYFGALKGIDRTALQACVIQTLKDVHLDEKANCTTSVLSGGMKKRLSVGIATISKPKVVVLDEPTAGLDPETRRDIWELFLSLRRESTLLIATHDMAEADALGDRVAVMSQGTVQCCGSPAFLKKAYGAGYQVHISRKPSVAFQLYDIMHIIKGTVPEAELRRHRKKDVTVVLHVLDCTGFDNMFAQLEAQSDALGIDSIGVTVSTIQDVFVKINREESNLLSRSFILHAEQDHAHRVASTEGAGGSCGSILTALFYKRLLCFYRSLVSPFTAWILPLLVFWALVQLEGRLVPEPKRWLRHLHMRLSLVDTYPGAGAFVHADDPSREVALGAFLPTLEAQAERLDVLADPGRQLQDMATRDFHEYTQAYALGISVTRRTIQQVKGNISRTIVQGWHNPYASISRELALSVASTAVLRLLTGDQRASILARTVIHDISEARSYQTKDIDEELTEYLKHTFLTTLLRTFLLPLGAALLMATMVLLPISERASGAKDLQMMTGLSGALYWFANWLFDFFVYIFSWATIFALISSYEPLLIETKLSLLVVLVAFSGPGILFSYTVSLFARTQSGGFTFLMLTYAVGGTVLLFAYFARKVTPRGVLLATSAGDVLFMLAPPFGLAVSLIKVMRMDLDNKECLRARQTLGHGGSLLAKLCGETLGGYARFGAVTAHCCAHANESSWQPRHPIILDVNGVGYELLVMLMEAVVLFCLLSYWDSGYHCLRLTASASSPATPSSKLDEDVRRERQEVQRLRSSKLVRERALITENLHKWYGSLHAVRGLTFTVQPQECLGLLGVNGSGKTSTFQMLTALLPPTCGDAYMDDLVLSREPRKWQARLGYCMQNGGLLDSLTAWEYLRLFARLRGVPSKDVKPLVEAFIHVVDLEETANRLCGTYSGGGKRKLSIAAALIGLPRLVFLDEPTAGVDVVAKARIFAVLADIMAFSGIAVVLTSHSMDDCESVCDRIGIMSEGQLQCLGSLQRLKDRFGRGHTLVLRLAPKERPREKEVQKAIASAFAGATLKDYTEGEFKFHLWHKLRWSEVFARVNDLQRRYTFEHAFVSDCSLEEIFVDIARGRHKVGGRTALSGVLHTAAAEPPSPLGGKQ